MVIQDREFLGTLVFQELADIADLVVFQDILVLAGFLDIVAIVAFQDILALVEYLAIAVQAYQDLADFLDLVE